MAARMRVRLVKSPISYTAQTRGTVRALGLRRINDVSELPDNPATRGMVRAVRFLVEVEPAEPAAATAASGAEKAPAGKEGHE